MRGLIVWEAIVRGATILGKNCPGADFPRVECPVPEAAMVSCCRKLCLLSSASFYLA